MVVDLAQMVKGQYPASYLRLSHNASAAVTPHTATDIMHMRHDINTQLVNLLLNIVDHKPPSWLKTSPHG
jgi:hypothetical protein